MNVSFDENLQSVIILSIIEKRPLMVKDSLVYWKSITNQETILLACSSPQSWHLSYLLHKVIVLLENYPSILPLRHVRRPKDYEVILSMF